MTEQLDRVKARRKAHRSVVTRLVNEATPILEGEITDKLLTRLRIIDGQLEDKGRLLSSFDEEIIALIDVAEIEADILESETVSDKIAQMRGEIKVVLESREAPAREENTSRSVSPTHSVRSVESDARDDHSTDPLAPVDRHSETRSPTTPESRSAGIKPKLPKLQLPKFAGDVTKFRTFWDSFDSAINQNADLSPIDKFSYLKTLVEGPAAHAIQGLTLSEANYAAAIELIKEWFGKPQQIISAHIDELLKLPSCSDDNAIQIRSVFDRIRVNARGLESLGVGSDQYGSFMIPIIMAKLPPAVRLQVARVTTRDVWNMDELLEVIKSEVEARELSEGIRVGEMKKPESVNRRPPIPTASALVTREGGPSRIKCVYCRGEHYSASCDKVNTVSARTEVLKKEGRCFLCLSNGHRASQCTSNKRCRKCGRKHHQSICVPSKPVEEKETTTNTGKETTTNLVRTKTCVLLQTARTYAYTSDENLIPVRLLMDNGSQRSYISNQLRSKLKLSPLRRERLTLNTFGNEQFNKKECDLVRIRLQTRFEEDLEVMALTFPAICSPLRALVEVEQYSHLHDLDLADVDSSDDHPSDAVDILIGSDYYWDAVIGDVARGKGGPVAVKSKFGWLLSGPVRPTLAENNHTVSNLILEGPGETGLPENNDIKLVDNLRQFWDTEAIGISPEFKEIANDSSFIEIRFDWQQQRYQVNLPWKTECRPQSNCYEMCVARLHQLRVRLQKDKDLFHEYNSIFESQLHDGIIERIPDTKQSSLCHYLPHHGVRRVDKETTKLRIIFNGSAKADRRLFSLNDCLNKGPNRIPHIFDMLLKFRSYPIGIIADIEKAFHQILIDPSDRDMLRFLWLDDIHKDRPGIVQYRFCRLVFGLTPSPAILTETIQYHLTRYLLTEPLRVKQLAESFYVDDFISGVCADDGGFNLYQKAKEIMRAGGFNLRKWKTNSPTLQKRINEAERSSGTPATHGSEQETVKILGLNWDCKADGLYFDLHKEVWRYCPGTINPADIASRSCSGQELVGQELWWRGPEFLRNSSESWPNLPTQYESEAADKEIVKSQSVITHSLVSLSQCDDTPNLSDLVDVKRYSSKLRLLRVTGWMLKFVAVLKAKDKNSVTCRLEADDLKRTETMWIRHIQRQCFVEEHNTLVLGKAGTVVYKNQLLFMNDLKLICCKSRLEHADLPVCSKNPVLLPSKHRFTELLIMETHQLVHHNGIQETLSAIRERYWIIRGREAVKKVVRRCVLCRKHEGNSYATPPVPPLPVERVSNMPPFNNTGLDFAGPLYVRDKLNGATDNQEIKVYVCLFTCASSRGLHLELTRDLSATVFLQAFRKFCARRGVPSTIMSDNAKTFKCCSKEVERVVRSEEVHQYLTNRQISWQFIVEKAPWWGGYWERMVRSVKRCLRKTLGRSTLTFDELGTVLVEIEATLNNRPLTYVYDDNEGLSYALTPADLIYGHRLVTSPSGRQFEVTSTAKTLTRRYKYQFRLLNNFVKKWQQDYLLSLQEKGVRGSKSPKQQIKTGDIVILRQDGTPRCLWKLAKVVELFKGRDEKIRSARVQLLRKDKVISLRRPIQHLIPLECH